MQTDTQGTDQTALVEELAAAVGIEPDAPESDSEPSSPDQAQETETPAATPDATSAEGTETAAPEAPPTPDATQAPADPLAGGEPFAFRVDGRQVPIDGATRLPDGRIVIPEAAWRNQVQNFVADRAAIQERERQFRQVIHREQTARKDWEQEKSVLFGELQQMFADPETMLAKLQNWQTEGPLLMARMEAKVAKAEAERFRTQQREAEEQEQEAALIPQLQNHFGEVVESWLGDHGITADAEGKFPQSWADWFRDVWEDHGKSLFYRDPVSGQPRLDGKVERLFQRELGRAKTHQAAASTTARKETLNAAAVAPPKTKAPPPARPVAKAPAKTPPRNAAGEFQKADEPFDPNRYLAGRKYAE